MIKRAHFTLIELLAVLLIFGILASIGLSISKPSPVKSEVSRIIAAAHNVRSQSIEHSHFSSMNFINNKITFTYTDRFTLTEDLPSPTSHNIDIDAEVDLKFYKQDQEVTSTPSLSFLSGGSLATSKSSYIDAIQVSDSNNSKNTFLITVSKVGSQLILEGEKEIEEYFNEL